MKSAGTTLPPLLMDKYCLRRQRCVFHSSQKHLNFEMPLKVPRKGFSKLSRSCFPGPSISRDIAEVSRRHCFCVCASYKSHVTSSLQVKPKSYVRTLRRLNIFLQGVKDKKYFNQYYNKYCLLTANKFKQTKANISFIKSPLLHFFQPKLKSTQILKSCAIKENLTKQDLITCSGPNYNI